MTDDKGRPVLVVGTGSPSSWDRPTNTYPGCTCSTGHERPDHTETRQQMSYDEHLISMAGGDGEPESLDLDAIQARADAATEGPWHVDGFGDVVRAGLPTDYIDTAGITQDSEFIAHARTDVPALLALVREQQARIGRVSELHRGTCEVNGEAGCDSGDKCQALVCGPCGESYPCPTLAALTATDKP